MRDVVQKLLTGLGITLQAIIPDGVTAIDSCDLQTSINFVTPWVYASPDWRYFIGSNASYDQAANWATNLLRAGVLGGGGTANVFTDHGAGAIFWTSPGGRYNLSQWTLTPENQIARLKEKEITDQGLQRLIKAIEPNLTNVVPIPELSYFPKDDRALLQELLSYPAASAGDKYLFAFLDTTQVEETKLFSTLDHWKSIGSFTVGQGNTSVHGTPQPDGPGFTITGYMYPL